MGGAMGTRGTAALAVAVLKSIDTGFPSSLNSHLPKPSHTALKWWGNEEKSKRPPSTKYVSRHHNP